MSPNRDYPTHRPCVVDVGDSNAIPNAPAGAESCALRAVKDAFHTSNSFPDLVVSILTSPAFVTRDSL